jgi:hypothetical protein
MPSPIRLATVADLLEHDHTLALFCPRCKRWSEAPLAALTNRGQGAAPIARLRFRCVRCGCEGERQLRPPTTHGPATAGWICSSVVS